MSFETEFTNIWKCAIEPAILEAPSSTLKANRIDATTLAGDTVLRILDGICHSRLVFVDISIQKNGRWAGQRNGNVMYELGLAHAWRQASEVIMVRNDSEPISFDVQSMFVHKYDPNDLSSAKVKFRELIESSLAETDFTKSLKVNRAVQALDHLALAFISRYSAHDYFCVAEVPPKEGEDFPMTVVRRDIYNMTTIHRLLELGIMATDVHAEEQRYAFHWTAFGKALCQQIGLPIAASGIGK